MRCPSCGSTDDKVVDSRQGDDGASIRRRRECLACGGRFTTFERLEEQPLVVVKRSGAKVAFDPSKIVNGARAAAKGRPVDEARFNALASSIEEELRLEGGGEVSSERIGLAVLEALRSLDPIAAVRFASVYLGFDDLSDFEREVTELAKRTAPKS